MYKELSHCHELEGDVFCVCQTEDGNISFRLFALQPRVKQGLHEHCTLPNRQHVILLQHGMHTFHF